VWAAAAIVVSEAGGSARAAEQPAVAPGPPLVVVNRTVPTVNPPSSQIVLSDSPSDSEIWRAHIFGEPLVPLGQTSPEDNRALGRALTSYLHRTNGDDFSSLTAYLDSHPNSPWRASVLAGLGVVYRYNGWFSKALDAWEEAWKPAKAETQPQGASWAYVDALDMRQGLNAKAPFSGDVAMRGLLSWH
jgi:hypothetical protein